jgi:2-iminobutanoate/2-iminopropanoate deaminase
LPPANWVLTLPPAILQEGIEAQTRQALANIQAVLAEAGAGVEHVVKTTIFLADMAHFATVNSLYAQVFQTEPPARSTVQVAALPKGGLVEIEIVALLDE